jgi:hypothetical protein
MSKHITKDEFDEWLDFPATQEYLDRLYAEIQNERRLYDLIEDNFERVFPKQQGRVQGLKSAVHIAHELAGQEPKEE